MKKIYEFELFEEVEREEEHKSKNDAGEEIITKKKVKEAIPRKFFLRQPTRSISEEAQLYYSSQVAKAIKSGLMQRAMIEKRYIEDNGIYTEKEKAEIKEFEAKFEAAQKEHQELLDLKKPSKKDIARKEELTKELLEISNKLQDIISYKRSLFSNSAETHAENKVSLYWLVFLSYEDKNGNFAPVLGEESNSFDERVEAYDEIYDSSDDDTFIKQVLQRFIYLVAIWMNNPNCDKETYDNALKMLDGKNIEELSKEAEEKEAENAKK